MLCLAVNLNAEERTAYPKIETEQKPDSLLTKQQLKSLHTKQRRDSIRANKKVWTSVLGGPSYTPEASLGIAAAALLSFKTNPKDTVSQRSFLPLGVNASINGTYIVAGAGTFFFNNNRFRIYSHYGFRNEPCDYYGVGMEQVIATERGDNTTSYHKQSIYLNNKFVWEFAPHLYAGPTADVGYINLSDLNEVMEKDVYVSSFARKYLNVGLGAILQYDTRDDIATPNSGMLLSGTSKFFGQYIGGKYNYQLYDLEYRQFKYLFGRSVLGWSARAQISHGDVPFTELPTFGSSSDLRGFYVGQYRDKSAGYGVVEYRQMFGSHESYLRGSLISKFGYVVWVGAGTLGNTPADWDQYRYNYGFGLRAQIQPRKNFRLDIGKGQGEDSFMVYFNMTEAF